jgi:hypothetical protein
MKKSRKKSFSLNPVRIAQIIVSLGILVGIIFTYNAISASEASVQPPDGEGIQEVYVDNLKGDDATGNGTMAKPYKTIQRGNYAANVSGAPLVRLRIKGTKAPYPLTNDMYAKRNNMQFLAWDGRPQVVGDLKGERPTYFYVQKYAGITLQGFDFQDVVVEIQSAQDVTIQDNSFIITQPDKLIAYTNSAVMDVREFEGVRQLENDRINIINNKMTIRNISKQPLRAIYLTPAHESTIENNTFTPAKDFAEAIVTVLGDSGELMMKGNRYGIASNKPLYNLIEVRDSQVY